MIVCPFLAVSWLMKFVGAIWFLTCIALVLIILIQKGRGGGLSSAFGGGGAGGVLGSKTGDFLTWVTITLVGVFLVLSVVMVKWYKPSVGEFGSQGAPSGQGQQQEQQQSSEDSNSDG